MSHSSAQPDSKTPLLYDGGGELVGPNSELDSEFQTAISKDVQAVEKKISRAMMNLEDARDYETAIKQLLKLNQDISAQIKNLHRRWQSDKDGDKALVHQIDMSEEYSEDQDAFWTEWRLWLLLFIVYLTLSNSYFMLRYNYDIVESMYVVVIIFTTVGYGIEIVEKEMDQFVVMLITIFGIAFVATGAGVMFMRVAERFHERHNRFINGEFDDPDAVLSDDPSEFGKPRSLSTRIVSVMETKLAKVAIWFFLVFGGGFLIGYVENWHWFESMYFIVMSGTTVGFGDYTPTHYYGKFLLIFYLPIAIACTSFFLFAFFSSVFYSVIDENKEELRTFKKNMKTLLNNTNFNTNILLMDMDGDGKVDEKEFMLQILCNEYEVDQKRISRIKAQFRRLDADGSGYIDQEDFVRFQQHPSDLRDPAFDSTLKTLATQ